MGDINDICAEYIFGGSYMHYEPFMFVAEKDGSFAPAKTLFEPDGAVTVQSSDLGTTYIENADYAVTRGGIAPVPGTSMPFFKHGQYYLDSASPGGSFPVSESGGHLVFGEGAYFHERQVSVSYRHCGAWGGPVPADKSAALRKSSGKARAGEGISVLFNGDSITTGANSSGCADIAVKPFVLPFPGLFARTVEKAYGARVSLTNIAVGGTSSAWGVGRSREYFNESGAKPDLYVVGFGMNDASGKVPAGEYIANIRRIIDGARRAHPGCEFILIATMLPNPLLQGFAGPHAEYAVPLLALESEYDGVAVANVTEAHGHLLTKKRYQDMTGNNVNHPNDFLARVYAQVLLKTFGV